MDKRIPTFTFKNFWKKIYKDFKLAKLDSEALKIESSPSY